MVPLESLGVRFPIAYHSNYGRICSRFDTIHERDRQTPHDSIGRAYALRGKKSSVLGHIDSFIEIV